MATGPLCGKDGRIRVYIPSTGAYQAVAGINGWRRQSRATVGRAVDFEAPTNLAGLPIARVCPGPVEISYEVEGYFFTDPATGVLFTSAIFDSGVAVLIDFLFHKGASVGIKGVTCLVESVTIGHRVDGMATFSANLIQYSADPLPLVS